MKRAFALICALILAIAGLTTASAEESSEAAHDILQDDYAMRGVPWDLPADRVAELEGGTIEKGNVRIDEPELYKLPGLRLTYLYNEDGRMTSRSFRMKKDDRYYASLFVSLYIRYGMPYFDDPEGTTKMWVLDDVTIELCSTNYVFVIYTLRTTE